MKVAAVIAAGGTGTRMNASVPKQFLEIAGKPILLHTIERIASLEEVIQIILALPEEHIPAADGNSKRARRCGLPRNASPGEAIARNRCTGACAMSHSDADVIMVHDAVRPVCDRDTMRRVLDAAWETGAAVPGLPATETIQRVSRKGRVLATPPREELFAIQTPQAFHAGILRSALDRAASGRLCRNRRIFRRALGGTSGHGRPRLAGQH